MTSILKVSEIQDPTNSNTALTIDANGGVTISETVIDSWRLTANFTTNAATITGWERPDDGFHAYINGLTESSGVFSFTKTGLYKIDIVLSGQNTTTGDGSFGAELQVSTDGGSSYDMAGLTFSGDSDIGANNSMSNTIHLNVTNTNTFKLRLVTISMASGTQISGNTDYNYTVISVLKVAPAQ